MVKSIVISGYYGFDNAGDELILRALLLDLRRLAPAAEIVVLSNNPVKTARLHRVKAIPRWNILRVTKAVGQASMLISGGGGLLQDVTNRHSILYYLGLIGLAELFRRKTVIYAQGIGPIHKKLNQLLTRGMLNKVDLVTVRDESSKSLLQALGVNKKVQVTADPTLGLVAGSGQQAAGSKQRAPVIGICVRRWKDFTGEAIAEAAAYLLRQKNARIIFIPFHLPDDYLFSQQIASRIGGETKVEIYNHPFDLLGIFSRVNLVLSLRLHGLILAGLYGVPMIGISVDPKIASFIQVLGQEEVGANVGRDDLIDKIEKVWWRKEFYTRQIRARLPSLQQRAKLTSWLVANLIDKARGNR